MIAKENFSPSVAEPVKAEENQKLADDKEITKEEEALSKLNRHGESKPVSYATFIRIVTV